MLGRLESAKKRYFELQEEMANPAVLSNPELAKKYGQELAEWEEIVSSYDRWHEALEELDTARELARDDDAETREWALAEADRLKGEAERLEAHLTRLMTPTDPNDQKNVIMEIRGGAGGEEAALFAASLFRMYVRYAERQGWRTEVLSSSPTDIGGYKEVIFMIEGRGAYSRLKYESGVHRVQRVPVTEAQGRIHTSTVTVAVLPEAEETELTINPDDLRIDTMRASGAGGQHVNKTESAVRITHLPTNIVVYCQDEKSQLKNREKAMRVLRARLKDLYDSQAHNAVQEERRSQVGTGDRSERIRTYNFPQGRVTDHRIGLTLHRIDGIMDGDLDELINALVAQDEEERLKEA
ncbi:peptide chain release factor 1 [Sulfobacillus harzensis]|uniref:Peptide chain release factor 1 n=1 Tax=Sulfobacillus harzensis TaxID=2729629 RepID=A0A7Y0Q2B7_9FIRM|nr:peptide chain release factor 1 [Sulfobacillus harzensis]